MTKVLYILDAEDMESAIETQDKVEQFHDVISFSFRLQLLMENYATRHLWSFALSGHRRQICVGDRSANFTARSRVIWPMNGLCVCSAAVSW